MNLTEVKKSLERQFVRELSQGAKRSIVFWYDEEGVFAEDIDSLMLTDVKIIKLYYNNMFAVKMYIEETDQESNLLVYSPLPRPLNRENWLTDTIKYSQIFSADETSNNMLLLGVEGALRHVMEKYKLFFRNSERFKRFESYNFGPSYSETKIDLGVHSALCKLPAPNFDQVVRTLLIEMVNGESTIYDNVSKFGNLDALWRMIFKSYDYSFNEQSLEKLLILLLCTHLYHSLGGSIPKDWKMFVADNPNCFVFVDNLMKNSQLWDSYSRLADFVAEKLGLAERVRTWAIEEIIECDTFEDFDISIIARIRENIERGVGEYERYRKIIHSRKNRRYFPQFTSEYEALLHACEYLELAEKHQKLQGLSLSELFDGYVKHYYRLDSSYRHFLRAYDQLEEADAFRTLCEQVENSYTNWYLYELSMKWCALLDDETTWQVPGVTSQQSFYDKYARRYVADDERIIVIISDALRYESAVELNAILNRDQKGVSELDVMLGVLPSYTALGMASLFPHERISITDNADIEVDGNSSKGTENRGKILRQYKGESIAVKFNDIIDLKPKQMSELFAGIKLIYIYHDVIDARGDNAPTEHEVYDATEKAFYDIDKLVRKLRNNISAINILITADHGYIYRRTKLEERDKTPKEDAAGILSKRRFILAREDVDKQGTQSFSMDYLIKEPSGLYAIVPRSINCFKVQGAGSCYVHGGTSLQEVVIPVIRFKSDKNLRQSMGAKKVSLNITNLSRKITSVITHLTFFQNEPVDEKRLPLRVTTYFADENGNRISNENIIIAESTSIKPEERTYREKFTLKDMAYDKSKQYYLVLIDDEEMVNKEIERIPFTIDLVFGGGIRF
ncbi:MAG: BREX-1 system phosphatase PglZ type A [Anaerocolumna sp.]